MRYTKIENLLNETQLNWFKFHECGSKLKMLLVDHETLSYEIEFYDVISCQILREPNSTGPFMLFDIKIEMMSIYQTENFLKSEEKYGKYLTYSKKLVDDFSIHNLKSLNTVWQLYIDLVFCDFCLYEYNNTNIRKKIYDSKLMQFD